jgi:two-component system, chemotaxis family, protein-glutamate methylesterase/glutaminase
LPLSNRAIADRRKIETMEVSDGYVIVIGASTGGVGALLEISKALPPFFPAPVCVVQHVGSNPSLLPELLRFRGRNHALHPEDGQRMTLGTLHVAPPDHHMLLDGMTIRLTRGPKENHARPAIDPLFRSAAATWGPRTIGVVLTGQMDDGTAGLKAIKDCGGIAIVQDPDTAVEPEMPRSALKNVAVDHCVQLQEVVPLLERLVNVTAASSNVAPPERVIREVAINQGNISVENLSAIADPSTLTCPDCHGSLWEVKDQKPLRYRCHTGHAYSVLSLASAQAEQAEQALWSSVRALREREILLRRFGTLADASGDAAQAAACEAQADRLRAQVRGLIELAESTPTVPELDRQA